MQDYLTSYPVPSGNMVLGWGQCSMTRTVVALLLVLSVA